MRKLILVAVVVLMAGGALAATLDIVGGQLLGASAENLGGIDHDVEFVDGTCNPFHNGCDDVSDFTLQTNMGSRMFSRPRTFPMTLQETSTHSAPLRLMARGAPELQPCTACTPNDTDMPSKFADDAIRKTASGAFDSNQPSPIESDLNFKFRISDIPLSCVL